MNNRDRDNNEDAWKKALCVVLEKSCQLSINIVWQYGETYQTKFINDVLVNIGNHGVKKLLARILAASPDDISLIMQQFILNIKDLSIFDDIFQSKIYHYCCLSPIKKKFIETAYQTLVQQSTGCFGVVKIEEINSSTLDANIKSCPEANRWPMCFSEQKELPFPLDLAVEDKSSAPSGALTKEPEEERFSSWNYFLS